MTATPMRVDQNHDTNPTIARHTSAKAGGAKIASRIKPTMLSDPTMPLTQPITLCIAIQSAITSPPRSACA